MLSLIFFLNALRISEKSLHEKENLFILNNWFALMCMTYFSSMNIVFRLKNVICIKSRIELPANCDATGRISKWLKSGSAIYPTTFQV